MSAIWLWCRPDTAAASHRLALEAEAQPVDAEAIIGEAKAWAEGRGSALRRSSARACRVDVLARAGFDRLPKRRRRKPAGKRVTREQVQAAIPPRKQFTITDLAEATGASPATVRSVIATLQDAGTIEEVGEDESHEGPGRAPKLYKRTRVSSSKG